MSLEVKMLELVGRTATHVTVVASGPAGIVRIATANAQRLFIEFHAGPGGLVLREVIPAPVPIGYSGNNFTNQIQAYKFADCPSIVAGEFYAQQTGIDSWTVVECVLLPG